MSVRQVLIAYIVALLSVSTLFECVNEPIFHEEEDQGQQQDVDENGTPDVAEETREPDQVVETGPDSEQEEAQPIEDPVPETSADPVIDQVHDTAAETSDPVVDPGVDPTADPTGDAAPDLFDPDYWYDLDSDGDTILDRHEGYCLVDTDGDTVPDCYDLDSDGDGHPDSVESGREDLMQPPIDTDGDTIPDFQDLDSDGDGLPDEVEWGCAVGSTERILADSDGDGYCDLSEVAIGSDPCDPLSTPYDLIEFYFVLPPGEEVVSSGSSAMEFGTDLVQMDVHFNMDTTGSMLGEINNLRDSLVTISSRLRILIPNTWFGVSDFRDFPCSPYGETSDWPYLLLQRISSDLALVQAALNTMTAAGGWDIPESGLESLYQIATGAGLNCSDCVTGCSIPSFTGGPGYFGGVGFRDGSLPVIAIHITDAVSHNGWGSNYDFTGPQFQPATVAALNANDIKVIGVVSSSGDPRSEMVEIAVATGTVVPLCAFDGRRPTGCATNQCCTGIGGQGTAPVGGVCPLVFTVSGDGSGLGDSIVDAIEFFANTTTLTVTAEVVGYDFLVEEEGTPAQNVNSACFIKAVTPDHFVSDSVCGPEPRIVGDRFEDVTAGARVFFNVTAENDDCVEPIRTPLLFEATINIWGNATTLLDTLDVAIVIPPRAGGPK